MSNSHTAAVRMTALAWRVHLPTALETTVRVATGPRQSDGPWPFTRALHELGALGVQRTARPNAAGSGRGEPLMASCELCWLGHDLRLETVRHGPAAVVTRGHASPGAHSVDTAVRDHSSLAGTCLGEASLESPPWDELVAGEATEDAWWDIVDTFCAAVDAHHGAITDGEAIDITAHDRGHVHAGPRPPAWSREAARHIALLTQDRDSSSNPRIGRAAADQYRQLPKSGLVVLLR